MFQQQKGMQNNGLKSTLIFKFVVSLLARSSNIWGKTNPPSDRLGL
jgi:hypothetical protein